MPINIIKNNAVENPTLTSSEERSFDVVKAIDISKFESLADNYVAAKEYPAQIQHLENYVRELNHHNILIKRSFYGYEIATDSIPETLLPKALVARLQATLTKLYTNSYVISKELQDIPVDKRRDLSQETNLKKEHVSTQLETAIMSNLLYSDNTHSTTVFSTIPTLDFTGVAKGADLKINDVEAAIKRKSDPTIKEQQVLNAIEGIRSFGEKSQTDPKLVKEKNTKEADISKILDQYKIAIDSQNVSLGTRSELGTYSQKILQNIDIDPASLNGKNALERTASVAGTLGYRTLNNGLNHFSMLVQNPARMIAVVLSLISLILPEGMKNSTFFKGLRQFTFWDSIALLSTNGEKGLVGLFKGTVNPMLEQMKGMADTSKPIDHDAVEELQKVKPVAGFEKALSLNETESRIATVLYQNITVGNLMTNTLLDEQTHDIKINTNALYTDEEKKILTKWPKFKADEVYKKMLTAVYDANAAKIINMTDKRLGNPPSGYTKEYLATIYLKDQYKYPLNKTEIEGNLRSSTTRFTTVFEYQLIKTSENDDKKITETAYMKWLASQETKEQSTT